MGLTEPALFIGGQPQPDELHKLLVYPECIWVLLESGYRYWQPAVRGFYGICICRRLLSSIQQLRQYFA